MQNEEKHQFTHTTANNECHVCGGEINNGMHLTVYDKMKAWPDVYVTKEELIQAVAQARKQAFREIGEWIQRHQAGARYFGRDLPDKLEPVARPCDTCTTNISQAIDHDSVECFETCAAY